MLMGDYAAMFCGALIRCEVVSSCCSLESIQGCMGECVCMRSCVSVCVWEGVYILAVSKQQPVHFAHVQEENKKVGQMKTI